MQLQLSEPNLRSQLLAVSLEPLPLLPLLQEAFSVNQQPSHQPGCLDRPLLPRVVCLGQPLLNRLRVASSVQPLLSRLQLRAACSVNPNLRPAPSVSPRLQEGCSVPLSLRQEAVCLGPRVLQPSRQQEVCLAPQLPLPNQPLEDCSDRHSQLLLEAYSVRLLLLHPQGGCLHPRNRLRPLPLEVCLVRRRQLNQLREVCSVLPPQLSQLLGADCLGHRPPRLSLQLEDFSELQLQLQPLHQPGLCLDHPPRQLNPPLEDCSVLQRVSLPPEGCLEQALQLQEAVCLAPPRLSQRQAVVSSERLLLRPSQLQGEVSSDHRQELHLLVEVGLGHLHQEVVCLERALLRPNHLQEEVYSERTLQGVCLVAPLLLPPSQRLAQG